MADFLAKVQAASKVLAPIVKKTPLVPSIRCSQLLGSEVFLKLENLQRTGSFKIRGAYHKISRLIAEKGRCDIVASSAGNHAQGVALAAKELGVQAHIVMPESAPLIKIKSTQSYGAEVILQGEVYDDAFVHAQTLAKQNGYVFIPPYADEQIIAGQGTVALEIFSEMAEFDTIWVPVGGGGLIAGVAAVAKALNPRCRVYGVQAERAPGMQRLFHGISESLVWRGTIADGLAVKNASSWMLDNYLKKYVDDIVTVSEEEIAEAIVILLESEKTVVEGAGAVGLAGVLAKKKGSGARTCVVVSGGNIDLNVVAKIIDKGLTERSRLARFSFIVDDSPGSLHRATAILHRERANILDVRHNRGAKDLGVRETRIEFLLETADAEHIERIRQALAALAGKVTVE